MSELLLGGSWFVVFAAAAAVAVRWSTRHSPAAIVIALACLFTLLSAPLGSVLTIEANYWRALAAFCFFTLCHLMIFGATYKSISLRILLDLLHAPGRRASAELIGARYIEQESFEARITAMIAQGFAVQTPEGLRITPKGRALATAAGLLHRLYLIERSG